MESEKSLVQEEALRIISRLKKRSFKIKKGESISRLRQLNYAHLQSYCHYDEMDEWGFVKFVIRREHRFSRVHPDIIYKASLIVKMYINIKKILYLQDTRVSGSALVLQNPVELAV